MAVLSLDTLTGCSSIPSFLGGTSDTPANPSITIFHNTSAPTNWTKNTSASINDIALRVIGGAEGVVVSTGGTSPFTTVFKVRTDAATTSPSPVGSLTPSPSGYFNGLDTGTNSPIVIDDATLSETQIPSHAHTHLKHPGVAAPATTAPGGGSAASAAQSPQTTGSGGGPGVHGHTINSPHIHPLVDPDHTHPFTGGAHTHTFSFNQNFNVHYVDVILATKD